jgi:hypothetical protein
VTHGAGLPARRLSSIAFLSAANRQNVSKAMVGRSKMPFMAIGFAFVKSLATDAYFVDTAEELSSLDSERDATSKSVLIGFRRARGALFSEGFLRMAGIL